jgi:predicted nucleotidyltransferase
MAESTIYHGIEIPRHVIVEFCTRHHIRRLSLFGSILRGNFGPQSDIDVLVEFEPGHTPGLAFFGMQNELSKLLGRDVDMHTQASISKYFRDEVLSTAQVQYDAA